MQCGWVKLISDSANFVACTACLHARYYMLQAVPALQSCSEETACNDRKCTHFTPDASQLLLKHNNIMFIGPCIIFISWIKRDQLDVTCFIISLFNAQHVSDVNTSIHRSLRLICWVTSWVVLLRFDMCWCYVVVWFGWCGIRMHCLNLHTDTTPPQQNHNVTPTHIEPEQYNPWSNSTNKSQAPEDGCINIRNMLSIK